MKDYSHIPVLLSEVMNLLEPKPNQNFVDATLGGGGYTSALLKAISPRGQVLAIDLDSDALENAKASLPVGKRLVLAHGNFADIDRHVIAHGFTDISGIVADIGLSSYQLDESGRGISFQRHELLDMRFDATSKQPDARFILNNYTDKQLLQIFREYGEEKLSGQIVRRIVRERIGKPIKYTEDLNTIIQASLPKPVAHRWQDSARRIYQALRIEVNHELENLQSFLPKAFDILAPGGHLAVVTFHSLEDRIVKQYFKGLSKGCVCPLEFPICKCGKSPQARVITNKAVTASHEELAENTRAKSAKLRVIQKV